MTLNLSHEEYFRGIQHSGNNRNIESEESRAPTALEVLVNDICFELSFIYERR